MGSVKSAISSPTPSAQTVPPLCSLPSSVKFPSNSTKKKNTFQVVAFCCKTLRQGLGAAEPSDRGPAVPFLGERKRRGRKSVGKVSKNVGAMQDHRED